MRCITDLRSAPVRPVAERPKTTGECSPVLHESYTGGAAEARPRRRVASDRFLHQGGEVLAVEVAGAVAAGVEVAPHAGAAFQRVEEQLLLHQVSVEQLLIEAAHGAFEDVWDAELLGAGEARGGGEGDLQDPAADLDLDEGGHVGLEEARIEGLGVEADFAALQEAVEIGHESRA